jgi:hypothetical protein
MELSCWAEFFFFCACKRPLRAAKKSARASDRGCCCEASVLRDIQYTHARTNERPDELRDRERGAGGCSYGRRTHARLNGNLLTALATPPLPTPVLSKVQGQTYHKLRNWLQFS